VDEQLTRDLKGSSILSEAVDHPVGSAEHYGIDVLERDGLLGGGVDEKGGAVLGAIEAHERTHVDLQPMQPGNRGVTDVVLNGDCRTGTVDRKCHLGSFGCKLFSDTDADPISQPVGDNHPGASFFPSSHDVDGMNDIYALADLCLRQTRLAAGCNNDAAGPFFQQDLAGDCSAQLKFDTSSFNFA